MRDAIVAVETQLQRNSKGHSRETLRCNNDDYSNSFPQHITNYTGFESTSMQMQSKFHPKTVDWYFLFGGGTTRTITSVTLEETVDW
eukprot:6416733-Amphidinium_carterae.1